MLTTLHERLQKLRRDPRAQPWHLMLRYGLGGGADSRSFVWLAPPGAAEHILHRMHNGLLLLQPASAELRAPVSEAALGPRLAALRQIHKIPIQVNESPEQEEPGSIDLPSRTVPQFQALANGTVAVGLDIGGTGMKCCAADGERILAKASSPTWPEGEQGIESLIRRARDLIAQVSQGHRVGSIGIGFASPMGIDGSVTSLSTVMQKRLGDVRVLDGFASQVSQGLCSGPTALFNDLTNLGRHLSGQGKRRLLRLQVGTSFGGCWIDADGTVNPSELGRLIIDAGPSPRLHTYLPIQGAMKRYLSGLGVGERLAELMGHPVSAWDSGYVLADLLASGDPRGQAVCDWIGHLLFGVIAEAQVFLGGLRHVEVGGSMLQGATGRRVREAVQPRAEALIDAPDFRIATNPGFDGALAAARAPLLGTPLRGMRRLSRR